MVLLKVKEEIAIYRTKKAMITFLEENKAWAKTLYTTHTKKGLLQGWKVERNGKTVL